MFNNLVNIHDAKRLIWGIRHGFFIKVLSRLTKGKIGRVKAAWKTTPKKYPASTWWIIPQVKKHWNRLITGDENISYFQYVSDKYFSGKKGLTGLSLGCGTGHRELRWADLCDFKKIDAFDISQDRINTAIQHAEEKGYSDIINYKVANIHNLELECNHYDAIFIEQSLHHFNSLEKILSKINRSLTSSGYFVINEYVGPSRFQWSDKQIKIANSIRSILPEKLRTHVVDSSVNKKIIKPSRLSMILKDPSEAIESSKITPLLNQIFEVVEICPYHGAILHLLFDGIAQNFLTEDEETQKYLQLCLEIEDVLTNTESVPSDYVVVICKKKY